MLPKWNWELPLHCKKLDHLFSQLLSVRQWLSSLVWLLMSQHCGLSVWLLVSQSSLISSCKSLCSLQSSLLMARESNNKELIFSSVSRFQTQSHQGRKWCVHYSRNGLFPSSSIKSLRSWQFLSRYCWLPLLFAQQWRWAWVSTRTYPWLLAQTLTTTSTHCSILEKQALLHMLSSTMSTIVSQLI